MLFYVYDFLSILFDKLKDGNKIKNISLFGSFARGNPRKDSDIDLFIDVKESDKDEISSITKEAINEFELKVQKTWKLKGITNAIVPIIDNLDLERWNELRKEISIYGIILYERYNIKISKDKKIIINYNLSKLKQKEKMRVIRKLLGYQIKKGNKIYSQTGLIEELGAEKFDNLLLASPSNYKSIIKMLREYNVPVKIREI